MTVPTTPTPTPTQNDAAEPQKRKKTRRGKRPKRPYPADRSLAGRIRTAIAEEEARRLATAKLHPDERYGTFWEHENSFEDVARSRIHDQWALDRAGCADEWHSEDDAWEGCEVSEDEPSSEEEEEATEDHEVIFIDSSEDEAGNEDVEIPSELAVTTVVPETAIPSNEKGKAVAAGNEKDNDDDSEGSDDDGDGIAKLHPSQPTGQYLIVICRLSGWSAAKKYQNEGDSSAVANGKVVQDRVREGIVLGQRLERYSPIPVQFATIVATCHQRPGAYFTNFEKVVNRPPAMVKDVRQFFNTLPDGAKVTALIRGPDGLGVDPATVYSLCQLGARRGMKLQLIFQYIKVYDSIRPLTLTAFKGLGSVLVLQGKTILQHMTGVEGKNSPEVARLERVLRDLNYFKNSGVGVVDRNALPNHNQMGAFESSAGAKVKRRRRQG
ncbi:hypothetical protein P153DRAFT_403113 [Dothidotthia symphoricarpi CBS 119687]|uniref:Uncharacterized protein n=1 Tax=Dothidotthia symphoricarpi CBS 119687 TaxID=1392245 RepID=A0A6A6ABR5_9PLEO|nr:uncharacterized protein P153DRAFT_403113 [Dothidotthia symphoricarpi CBS 119687]KAF2129382.1 hypothetical protein P153DRAFT_403113 [Dothidotthia symphoricarpi CBS 119687]